MEESKIVIGHDLECRDGADAIRLGRELAWVLEAQPLVAAALPWPRYLLDPAEIDPGLIGRLERELEAVARPLADLGVETRLVPGPTAAAALEELAVAEDARLIVVGSSRRGALGRTLAGSVGESLAHGASCAVAVAPHGYAEADPQPFRRIGVAFDGSPESWSALETAIGVASSSGASVTVLTVADLPVYSFATPWSGYTMAAVRRAARADTERLLGLARSRVPEQLDCETRLLEGEPGEALARVSSGFDLLLAGSRSWGPLLRALLGSTTRRLIADSACPVLVVPRGAGVDPLRLDSVVSARSATSGRDPRVSAPTT